MAKLANTKTHENLKHAFAARSLERAGVIEEGAYGGLEAVDVARRDDPTGREALHHLTEAADVVHDGRDTRSE